MKYVYFMLGLLCVGVGSVGIVLPVLPTTPLFLLALFFFAKSSRKAEEWFVSTNLYKKHLESFVENRSMTLKTKVCILLPASAMLMMAFLAMENFYGRCFIAFLIAFKYYYFTFHIDTIKEDKVKS